MPFDAAGMAAQELADAAGYCTTCSQQKGNAQAVWKLTGDVQLQFHATTPIQTVSHPLQPFLCCFWLHLCVKHMLFWDRSASRHNAALDVEPRTCVAAQVMSHSTAC